MAAFLHSLSNIMLRTRSILALPAAAAASLLGYPAAEAEAPAPPKSRVVFVLGGPGAGQRLVEAGRLPEQDVEALGQAVWACLHGLIALPAIRPDVQWAPELVERSIDALLIGWLAKPTSSPQAAPPSGLRAVQPASPVTSIQRAHSQETK